MRPLAKLKPYPKNARQHPPEQVGQIVASMREYGFTIPVLVDEDDMLIAGHGRVMAAQQLVTEGRAEFAEVPTMIAIGWTDAQRRAYVIADNRLTETSRWDRELLRSELRELRNFEHDLPPVGFSDKQITKMLEIPDLEAVAPKMGGLEFSIVVKCESEEHQGELLAKFDEMGLECRTLIA